MKKILVASFFICFLILSSSIAALETSDMLVLELTPEEQSTHVREAVSYQMKISNHQNINDSFVVRITGEKLYFITQPVILVKLESQEEKTFTINIFPSDDKVKTYAYNIFVKSITFPGVNASADISLSILPPLIIEDFSGNLEVSEVSTELPLIAGREMDIYLVYSMQDFSGRKIFEKSFTETVDGEETVIKSFSLPDKILAGDYRVMVNVNNQFNDSFVFSIHPVHNVVKTVKRISSPLSEEVIISITNKGNVIEKNYEIHEKSPSGTLTGFFTTPVKCEIEEQDRTCTYVIMDLGLDETREIRYKLEFYPTYIQIGLVILIILAIIIYSFKSATKPKVSKRYIRKGRNTHNIVIEIRNPFFHNLKNVIVRDWVSPLGHVLKHEVEHLNPIIRKSDAGTELIWKLGDIKPKEHRIITYKIKTLVQGSLKMPKAQMRFLTPKGKKWRVKTNSLVIE